MSDSPLLPSNAKWLYLPYVVCRIGKGAATAAPRLSFLSPSSSPSSSLHGYPNFTPESQYLLITLQGIVLYSPPPLPPSLPARPLRRPTFSFFVFSPPFNPSFSFLKKKEKHKIFFAPVKLPLPLPPPLAAVLRDTSSGLGFRGGGGGTVREQQQSRDENSPHDSFILGNERLPKFEEIRGGGKRHLCTPRPRINL